MLDLEIHSAGSQKGKNVIRLEPHKHKIETDKNGLKFISILVTSDTRSSWGKQGPLSKN